jgi:ribosomal protein L21
MFAIVEDGSRQLRVQEGETFRIDYRDGAEPGQTVGHRQKYTTVKINSIKVPGLKIVEKSDDK